MKDRKVQNLLNVQFLSGNINTVTLANQIKYNSELIQLDSKLNLYLFNKNLRKPYSLSRFLVLCSVLNSDKIRNNSAIRENIRKFIVDPYYNKWIFYQYYYGGPI
jgi:hypothetical protein